MVEYNEFFRGIMHPVFGIDHLLAMIAVGIIGAQMGKRAIWTLPATFVSFMVIGSVINSMGIRILLVEPGIALSLLVLGVAIALSKKMPLAFSAVCIALFAVLHGHAHGQEISLVTAPMFYAVGFVISTVLLHMVGIITGRYARKTTFSMQLLRTSGVAISLAGIYFLFGL